MLAFQDKTLTWTNGHGVVRRGPDTAQISDKPSLGFDYDSLYAEETHAFRVVRDVQKPLSEDQIAAVVTWLDTADLSTFQRVLGVDEFGHFIGECRPSECAQVVRSTPPTEDFWRFDFDTGAWLFNHVVGNDGRYLGNLKAEAGRVYASSAPPPAMRNWRWRGDEWRDETPLESAQADKINEAWAACEQVLERSVAKVTFGDTELTFGADRESRENILGLCTAIANEHAGLLPAGTIPNPRPYYPKGAVTPFAFPHEGILAIGAAVLLVKDTVMGRYFAHKAAIKALSNRDDVDAYDVTLGWPT